MQVTEEVAVQDYVLAPEGPVFRLENILLLGSVEGALCSDEREFEETENVFVKCLPQEYEIFG